MSDTPETNAFATKLKTNCGEKYWVPVDLSRRLERERDEARKMLVRSNHFLQQAEENLESIYKERDEAREESQRLRVQLNHFWQANEMAEQAFRERDEAHKIAEKAIDDLAWFNETNAKILGNELEQLKEKTK